MKTLSTTICLALCAVFSRGALAFFIDPCNASGAIFITPDTPAPNDPIGVGVIVPSDRSFKYKLLRRGVDGEGRITLDAVLTDSVEAFPDYTIVSRPFDEIDVYIGPFPAGVVAVVTTVSTFDASGVLKPVCDPNRWSSSIVSEIHISAQKGFGATSTKAPVVEFYNASLDHYFMTMDAREINDLDTGVHPGWERTGKSFVAYSPAIYKPGGGGPAHLTAGLVRRFYGLPSVGLDSHFFTLDVYEWLKLETTWPLLAQWFLETDNAFQVWPPLTGSGFCPVATVPVYRLWNGRLDSNHRYTTDLAVREAMIAKGWIPEGYGPLSDVMCAPAS